MPHCPRLGGRCILTGDHWDHHGPMAAIPAPQPGAGPGLVDARLEAYDDGRPLLVLGWGGDTADLDVGQALRLATRFVVFAGRLVVLAAQLAVTRRRG